MPSHSFLKTLHKTAIFLSVFSLLPSPTTAWLNGSCTSDPSFPDILRFELSPNAWSDNTTLQSQRGVFLWVGQQNWYMPSLNLYPVNYPLLTILSTSHNGTYISTSVTGSQAAPCPNSYTGISNFNYSDSAPWDDGFSSFNSSYSCLGYYNFETDNQTSQYSTRIIYENDKNFTGSPETSAIASELVNENVQHGLISTGLVLPQSWSSSGNLSAPAVTRMTTIGHYGIGSQLLGFVDDHTDQVFGLGFNSTLINSLYENGYISSRSVGLHYGMPETEETKGVNGTYGSMVLGGYSSSRLQNGVFVGDNYTVGEFKLPRGCPWEVDVSSISSGTQSSSQGFTACVDPSELQLVLPSSLYTQVSTVSSSDLTITLTNNLTVTIPSNMVSIRSVSDEDQSPILGAPWLSLVYLFVDYQERTLSVGLADNTSPLLKDYDVLECIEHDQEMGDLGWAVTNGIKNGGATSTTSTGGSKETGKNGAGREGVSISMLFNVVVGVGILMY